MVIFLLESICNEMNELLAQKAPQEFLQLRLCLGNEIIISMIVPQKERRRNVLNTEQKP